MKQLVRNSIAAEFFSRNVIRQILFQTIYDWLGEAAPRVLGKPERLFLIPQSGSLKDLDSPLIMGNNK